MKRFPSPIMIGPPSAMIEAAGWITVRAPVKERDEGERCGGESRDVEEKERSA